MQYLQLVLRLTPLHASVATLPWAVAFAVGSLVTPRLTRRWSPVSILVWGLVLSALSFALLTLVGPARSASQVSAAWGGPVSVYARRCAAGLDSAGHGR